MNAEMLRHYRHCRDLQQATWRRENNSGGGSWPGCHAETAYRSACAHVKYLERIAKYTKLAKRARRKTP